MSDASDYALYRGKCKEMSEEACKKDKTLTLVRGHYFCPISNREEEHWWTVRPDGEIFDPSRRQFMSKGFGIYTPFNGMCVCEECGKEVPEEEAIFMSRYPVCSDRCAMRLVGL